MQRRIEIWRKDKLVDVDEKFLDLEDLVVDAGLNALCGQAFDGSGSRPAVFNYVAIGADGTAPASGQTALGVEVMRVQGTYSKDASVGECSMDATFNITSSYALQECGLFNASSGGTMYCRDTYATKNVVSGDTVKAFEEFPRMRPKFIIRLSSKDLLRGLITLPNLIKVTCKNCRREFEAKASRLNSKYGITYCSRECYINYYKTHRGHPLLYATKPKIKLTCKKCGRIFEVKPSEAGMSAKRYSRKYCSQECALTDIHRSRKGSHRTEEEKQAIRERFQFHQKAVIEQADALRQQGFKVVITDKVRPDIIARKDDKIYAVEVEFTKPDYDKYKDIEIFDDIMWIVKDYTPKFQVP